MIALVDGEPKTLNLKNMLELFLSHRLEITIRKYEYELAQARFRGHILEGYLKALDVIDEVISTIRASKTQEEAKSNLIDKFDFTEVQTEAILEMQLRRLAALEREKIQSEFSEIKAKIENYTDILSSDEKVLEVIDKDLKEFAEKHGDDRRTRVVKGKIDEISEEDMVAKENTFITISRAGYIKRVAPDTYRTQKRGGKGIKGATTKEGDYIEHAMLCHTHTEILLFTNQGRVFCLNAYDIPEYSRTAKGLPIVNLLQIDQQEIITSVLAREDGNNYEVELESDDEKDEEKRRVPAKYLFMATRNGTVKKTELSEFENIRSSGLIAIKLRDGDELGWVEATTGEEQIMLLTKKGKSIRFNEKDARPQGRNTYGVTGIRFKKEDDIIISMKVVNSGSRNKIFVISENGYGKMTKLSEYSAQKRGGSGIYTFKIRPKTGDLVGAEIIDAESEEMVVMSESGTVIRLETKGLPELRRQTSGVKIMNVDSGDRVTAVSYTHLTLPTKRIV